MPTHATRFYFSDRRDIPARFTEPQTVYESADLTSRTTRSTCRLRAGLTKKEKDAILRYIAHDWSTYCTHDHDCCGNWYRTCWARIDGRRLTLTTHHCRNV